MQLLVQSMLYATTLLSAVPGENDFCSIGFWQNSRVMGFNTGGQELSSLEVEIATEGGNDRQVFNSASWKGERTDFWQEPISLSVDVNWEQAPPANTTFVLLIDGQERARKLEPRPDPATVGFQWDISDNPPNVFGHRLIEILWLDPSGKQLRRHASRLPNWSYLRLRAQRARRELVQDFARDKRLCRPGLVI